MAKGTRGRRRIASRQCRPTPYPLPSYEEDGFDVDVTGRNEGFELGIDGNLVNVFLLLQAFGRGGNVGHNRRTRQHDRGSDRALDGSVVGFRHPSPVGGFDLSDQDSDVQDNGGGDGGGMSLVHRLRRQGRILLGRSGRRQRSREASGGQR
ncbi:hypothetical protein Acr_07g0009080 [Actinidia rufa]|uniref:Uncharacterized protein n=1 Tax=Actinidia rufa TaxID=165716 RepID=A0A7J0EW53_9ERIC|nr:hypothetical protein Acr_07g0009080 [Actinidia rufa]